MLSLDSRTHAAPWTQIRDEAETEAAHEQVAGTRRAYPIHHCNLSTTCFSCTDISPGHFRVQVPRRQSGQLMEVTLPITDRRAVQLASNGSWSCTLYMLSPRVDPMPAEKTLFRVQGPRQASVAQCFRR